jgi:hypothetical protein
MSQQQKRCHNQFSLGAANSIVYMVQFKGSAASSAAVRIETTAS